jgi:hypothetical protein
MALLETQMPWQPALEREETLEGLLGLCWLGLFK